MIEEWLLTVNIWKLFFITKPSKRHGSTGADGGALGQFTIAYSAREKIAPGTGGHRGLCDLWLGLVFEVNP